MSCHLATLAAVTCWHKNRCCSDEPRREMFCNVHNALAGLPPISYSLLSGNILCFVANSRQMEIWSKSSLPYGCGYFRYWMYLFKTYMYHCPPKSLVKLGPRYKAVWFDGISSLQFILFICSTGILLGISYSGFRRENGGRVELWSGSITS